MGGSASRSWRRQQWVVTSSRLRSRLLNKTFFLCWTNTVQTSMSSFAWFKNLDDVCYVDRFVLFQTITTRLVLHKAFEPPTISECVEFSFYLWVGHIRRQNFAPWSFWEACNFLAFILSLLQRYIKCLSPRSWSAPTTYIASARWVGNVSLNKSNNAVGPSA